MGRGWLKVMDELQGTTELDNWANSAPSAPLQRGTSKGIFSYEWKEIRKKKNTLGVRKIMGTSLRPGGDVVQAKKTSQPGSELSCSCEPQISGAWPCGANHYSIF